MRRRYARYLGLGLLAATALLLWAFGAPTDPGALLAPDRLAVVLQMGGMILAAALFVLAGYETPVAARVGWHRLAGLGDVLLGLSLALSAVSGTAAGGAAVVYRIAVVAGGLSLAFIGFDVARGGRHLDVDPGESA